MFEIWIGSAQKVGVGIKTDRYWPSGEIQESPRATPAKLHFTVPCATAWTDKSKEVNNLFFHLSLQVYILYFDTTGIYYTSLQPIKKVYYFQFSKQAISLSCSFFSAYSSIIWQFFDVWLSSISELTWTLSGCCKEKSDSKNSQLTLLSSKEIAAAIFPPYDSEKMWKGMLWEKIKYLSV